MPLVAVAAPVQCSAKPLGHNNSCVHDPSGKLPFELPSSTAAVEAQFEDVPYDSANPLFEFGYGLTFANAGSHENSDTGDAAQAELAGS